MPSQSARPLRDPTGLFKNAFPGWPLARLPVSPPRTFQRNVDWISVQRHPNILGLFARPHHRDGKPKYLIGAPRFIVYPGDVLPRHPLLQPLAALLDGTTKPALQKIQTP